MVRLPRSTPSNQPNDAHDVLSELLRAPLPDGEGTLRPVTLRSNEEQRRLAFRPFLLRTWFDYALHRIERILVLAMIGFFAYWFIDGYGRDWLHQMRQNPVAARPAVMHAPPSTTDQTSPLVASDQARALPFTTPDMERSADSTDFLAPQLIALPRITADPRPQRLVMPAIGVDTPVAEVFVQDGAWQVADYAAGYHHGSALPGTVGNTVMAGHAGLRGAVFRDLGALKSGDEIIIEAGGWNYRYEVREVTSVWPTQIEVLAPTPTPVLTLITCTAWDTQRLIVVADLVDSRPLS